MYVIQCFGAMNIRIKIQEPLTTDVLLINLGKILGITLCKIFSTELSGLFGLIALIMNKLPADFQSVSVC